jgi:hypothetical protein
MVVVMGKGVPLPRTTQPFSIQQAARQIFKDDVNGCSSNSDICTVPFSHGSKLPSVTEVWSSYAFPPSF